MPNPVLQAQVNKNNLLVLEQIKNRKNQTEEATTYTLGKKEEKHTRGAGDSAEKNRKYIKW